MEFNFEYVDQEWTWDKEKSKQSTERLNEYLQWLGKMISKYGYFYSALGPEKCPIDI